MENMLDIAQELIDVMAGNPKALLLGIVQFPGKSPRRQIVCVVLGHDSSRLSKLAGVICPLSD
jgi:hypothetical protein